MTVLVWAHSFRLQTAEQMEGEAGPRLAGSTDIWARASRSLSSPWAGSPSLGDRITVSQGPCFLFPSSKEVVLK